jgi:hypothetical protein
MMSAGPLSQPTVTVTNAAEAASARPGDEAPDASPAEPPRWRIPTDPPPV